MILTHTKNILLPVPVYLLRKTLIDYYWSTRSYPTNITQQHHSERLFLCIAHSERALDITKAFRLFIIEIEVYILCFDHR